MITFIIIPSLQNCMTWSLYAGSLQDVIDTYSEN